MQIATEKIIQGILRRAIMMDFIMQMRSSGTARVSRFTNSIAAFDLLALFHIES